MGTEHSPSPDQITDCSYRLADRHRKQDKTTVATKIWHKRGLQHYTKGAYIQNAQRWLGHYLSISTIAVHECHISIGFVSVYIFNT